GACVRSNSRTPGGSKLTWTQLADNHLDSRRKRRRGNRCRGSGTLEVTGFGDVWRLSPLFNRTTHILLAIPPRRGWRLARSRVTARTFRKLVLRSSSGFRLL